jgi:parvulin-like peptidyl-prolyl isomerase
MKLRFILATACLGTSVLAAPQQLPVPQPPPGQAPASARPSGPIEVNGIAAKVNGRVVTKNQVSFMLAPVYAQLATQFPRRGPEFERLFKEAKNKVLDELIDREIILDEFKQLGATIKPAVIDEEVDRQIHELYNGSEAKFLEELKKNRLTMDGYKLMTQDKLVVQAMRAKHFSDAPPPLPKEIEKEYAEIKTSLRDMSKDVISFQKIFIPRADQANTVATPESQLAIAEDLVKQLEAGKDFAELAKANSKDAFAETGGVQENVPRIDLSPEFASILFDAEIGKVLGPLEDPQGFTVLKVTNKVLGPSPSLSDKKVHDMVEDRVRRKKTAGEYDNWIAAKRKRAMVDRKM